MFWLRTSGTSLQVRSNFLPVWCYTVFKMFWVLGHFRFFGSGNVNQNLRLEAGHWQCIPTCKPTIPETEAGDCRYKVILGDTEILSQENMNVSVLNFFQSAWHIWDPSVTNLQMVMVHCLLLPSRIPLYLCISLSFLHPALTMNNTVIKFLYKEQTCCVSLWEFF